MSIVGLMSRAAAVDTGAAAGGNVRAAEFAPDEAPAAATRTTPSDVAAAISSRIPTEAIAVYTAVLAFLVDDTKPLDNQSYGSRWGLTAAVAFIAVLYAVGLYRQKLKAAGKTFKFPIWRVIVVVVSFLVWVALIPGSPFNDFDWYSLDGAAIVGILVNAILGGLALFYDSDSPSGS